MLKINEIFKSVQGESSFSGLPCVFIRLTGCNLRCGYCDTEYAFYEGKLMSVDEILNQVERAGIPLVDLKEKKSNRMRQNQAVSPVNPSSVNIGSSGTLVEITGGEPLLQKEVYPLMDALLGQGYEVLLETGGSLSIKDVPDPVIRIMDLKCPGSGEVQNNLLDNIQYLTPKDEVKFVILDRADYEWSRDMLRRYSLDRKAHVLFSPVYDKLDLKDLTQWILEDNLPVRLQTQLHKVIWDKDTIGV